jgi:tetratricopeptide (TPR) repeat protein
VIDSMGWVQYRLGRLEEAERYLRKAYGALKDAEIAGHLVEVLWARGKREEARRILREALKAHPRDEYLRSLAGRISG